MSHSGTYFAILVVALMLLTPVYAGTGHSEFFTSGETTMESSGFTCHTVIPSPNKMSDYLWGQYHDKLIAEYPQLSVDTGKMHSTALDNMIFNDTPLAIHLDEEYPYGTPIMGGGVQPYDIFWDPFTYSAMAKVLMQRDLVNDQDIWTCLRNLGFDKNFTVATIALAHTMPWGAYYMSSSSQGPTFHFDPAVYGKNPYWMMPPEPGFTLRRDGHAAFGLGGCPYDALYYYDYSMTPPKEIWEDSAAACFGSHLILLVVPEKVVDQIGLPTAMKAGTFAGMVSSGGIFDLIGREEHQSDVTKYETNWEQWRSSYLTLINALNDYSRTSGLNYNFTHFTRFPYDTRFPPDIESKIIWDSFPSPIEEILLQFAATNVTVNDLWTCIQDPYNCNWAAYSGRQMAQAYAERVYAYMQQYGLFAWDFAPNHDGCPATATYTPTVGGTYSQGSMNNQTGTLTPGMLLLPTAQDCAVSFIRPWLAHYIDQAKVNALPDADVYEVDRNWGSIGTGRYQKFNYTDAYSKFQQPTTFGLTRTETATGTSQPSSPSSSSPSSGSSAGIGPQSIPIYIQNSTQHINSTESITTVTKTVTVPDNRTQQEAGTFMPLIPIIPTQIPISWVAFLPIILALSAILNVFVSRREVNKGIKRYFSTPMRTVSLRLPTRDRTVNKNEIREIRRLTRTIRGNRRL
jgi:hypothetical protein